ncbi:MAG: hypothetical protein CL728_03950 [Chloroflexi bacterium]|jgi:hypothetical protein|nr:hypothetical protein [Chloroflexota bacterium]|tara:strand:- start:10546 stop:11082 length:537 start_codon:yes stop_codon:yes gene_type:complete
MEEMIVDSLKINAMGQRVMILKQKTGSLYLAIWIAAAEADAIAIRMQKVDVPRPLTHDLFCNVIEKFDGQINKIIIDNLDTGTFFAKIIISIKGKEIELDSRPSDAMVIALKLGIPIMCVSKVIEKAGFQKSNLDIDKSNEINEDLDDQNDAYSPLGEKERKSLSVFESFIDSLDLDE